MGDQIYIPKTERINNLTIGIDTWPIRKILEVMNQEDHKIAPAIRKEIPKIEKAVDLVVTTFTEGGRLFYAGAGTSGRLGILDSAELAPTFGLSNDETIALMCGGKKAVFSASEDAEDREEDGIKTFMKHNPCQKDTVIGISASGATPFVLGIIKTASFLGVSTIALTGDAAGPITQYAQTVICPDVGPEIIAGSTRLKNGTAHKIVLNMISTASMIALGRTYSNLMATTSPTNKKLSQRARRILCEATGLGAKQIEKALSESDGNIPIALIILLTGLSANQANSVLKSSSGSIRQALNIAAKNYEVKSSYHHKVSHDQKNITGRNNLVYGTPQEAGLNPEKIEQAFEVVRQTIGDGQGLIPGAVAAIVRNDIMLAPRAWGWAVRTPQRIPTTVDTIFDMASLTKVMATLPAILMLCEQGKIRLDDPVALFIPNFGANNKKDITIRHLITHTSGLPDHIRFWKQDLKGQQIIKKICDLSIGNNRHPGKQVIYSDLGFMLLGEIIKCVSGLDIKQFSEQNIFEPLGMHQTCFVPRKELKPLIAATEYRRDLNQTIWGKVHDENAYALGGIAGHAGLFSTAADTVKYALMWLNNGKFRETRILSPKTVSEAIKEQVNLQDRRSLGWMLKSKTLCSGGDFISENAFGHTGFTGTSLWCDPNENLAIILLTNRVHAGRTGDAHIRLRARFANAVCASIEN